jgi:phosphoglycerate dehydrogenase-like enzyme
MRKKLLYIGKNKARMPEKGPFIDALNEIGELKIIKGANDMPDSERTALIRECNILLTMWDAMPVPKEIASNRGKLEYICNITGELKWFIPLEIIDAGIPVTNWGDAPADSVAEGAMSLLFAVMKDINGHIKTVREGGWAPGAKYPGGSLKDLNVGIYGMGAIGRRFVELIRPFKPVLRSYDPYIKEMPEGCAKVNSLDELFSLSQAVVIHAGLSAETRKSVNARLLAKLPDYGIIINTARGGIVDQDALLAELEKGRLRAGIDVLDGDDMLPVDHPARNWDNCIFTAHGIGRNNWNVHEDRMKNYEEICIDNLKRHINGEPLRFIMDHTRYIRST